MLTEFQLVVIGLAASVIVYALKLLKVNLSAGWLTTGVYVAALGLAFYFAPLTVPAFPPFTDPVTFVQALVAWIGAALIPLSAFVGFATLVYNVLLKNILYKYGAPLFKRAAKFFNK